MTMRLSSGSRSAAADAVVDRLDAVGAGTIKIYSGAQPANPQTGPSGVLLATITLNAPAFTAATTGAASLIVTPALTTTGVADGTAGWFRAADGGGTAVFDGACGTSGQELNLTSTTIATGGTVNIVSGTYTQPQ